jgi:hypothetical protein
VVPNRLDFLDLRQFVQHRHRGDRLRCLHWMIGRSAKVVSVRSSSSAASLPDWMMAIRWQCSASSR